jgi:hypothetical protein
MTGHLRPSTFACDYNLLGVNDCMTIAATIITRQNYRGKKENWKQLLHDRNLRRPFAATGYYCT